ncbi:MAG: hypothetical protein FD189_1315, partial [Elusimicrobia bacterium]
MTYKTNREYLADIIKVLKSYKKVLFGSEEEQQVMPLLKRPAPRKLPPAA